MNPLTSLIGKLQLRLSYCHFPPDRLSLKQLSVRGLNLVVPINEDVGRLIYYLGVYEPRETDYVMRTLQSDDICFDVGANFGYYTVLMANVVRQGRVYAFEPDPLSQALLQLNVRINNLKNVVVNGLALGSEVGTSRFVRFVDSGFNSFKNTARKAISSIIEVPVTSVDEYIAENHVERLDFMKLDVEGAEGLVLAGAEKLLRDPARRPRLIMLELFEDNHKPFGDCLEEIVEDLRGNHYEPFVLSEKRRMAYRKSHENKYCNVLFSSHRSDAP